MLIELDYYQKQTSADFYIKNYKSLDAYSLQSLVEFALERGGFFREDMHRFSLKKRADLEYMQKLFSLAGLEVFVREPKGLEHLAQNSKYGVKSLKPPAVASEVINFGKHRGELWGDLPTTYLKWIQGSMKGHNSEVAKKIIIYRKTVERNAREAQEES